MQEGSFLANFEAEQHKMGQDALDSYKINGAAVFFCLVTLWWDSSRIGASVVLGMMALYNLGLLWHNKMRLDRALERDKYPAHHTKSDDHEK